MTEELQGLLNRIQQDGLNKAESEHAKIVADANDKAAKIVAEAQEQAAQILKQAQDEVKASEEKAAAAIRQAARDVLIALKEEILNRMRNVVKACAGQAMTPDVMARIVGEMAHAYAGSATGAGVEVMLPAAELETLGNGLMAALAADLRTRAQILPGHDFTGGLKIGFSDSDVFLDFSDEALSEIICDYIGPKLAAVLKG